ncbi:hypothetical protein IFM89_025416 [Coptis chinensis]|uniref:Pentatricopeptide repeat-containing protein n=1 Tax=Coptis chinensis TaxID=261450 RepID=A0A835GY12_9MAGN|nr:hypothetical protein IFM89_025416 [Coptis chinensis]
MVDAYGKCLDINAATFLFTSSRKPTASIWNVVISGYSHNHTAHRGLDLFVEMLRFQGFDSHLTIGNAMMDMYIRYGCMKSSVLLFKSMSCKNIVTWNTMFKRGVSPNSCSFNAMIGGHCRAGSGVSEVERWLKAMFEKVYFLDNGECTMVVDFFCKRGCTGKVFGLFEKMVEKGYPPNVINYTALANGLCKWGSIKQAFEVLKEMVRKGWNPNVYIYAHDIDQWDLQERMDREGI